MYVCKKKEQKKLLGSQFDVSMIESHADGLERAETPEPRRYAKQPSVSSLFKWCERHFERRRRQHLPPRRDRRELERQEGKHQS